MKVAANTTIHSSFMAAETRRTTTGVHAESAPITNVSASHYCLDPLRRAQAPLRPEESVQPMKRTREADVQSRVFEGDAFVDLAQRQ